MNEKGFMFPVTLCILLLFSIFLTVHFHQYVTDKSYLKELEHFERNQFYFLQSLKKVERQLNEEVFDEEGTFIYEEGTVSYTTIAIGENVVQITFRLNTDKQTDLTAMCIYDTNRKKMMKWIERN